MQAMNPQSQNSQSQDNQNGKPSLSWSQPATPPKAITAQMPKKPDSKSSTGAYVGVFVGGLVVGALVGWGITGLHSGSMNSMDMSAGSMSSGSTMMGTSSMSMSGSTIGASYLTVPAQSAGYSVAVSGVSVSQPTWVVIYDDSNGKAGNALGAGLFYPASMGGTTSGSVSLLRATLPNTSYIAGESLDNGSRQFSLKDAAVMDGEGNPLWVTFKTN